MEEKLSNADDVVVRVRGLQKEGQNNEVIETMARGRYYLKNGRHYLLYDEIDEENGEKTKNIVKFDDNFAELTRKGFINTNTVFCRGKSRQSLYSTPYGETLFEIVTKDVKLKKIEDGLNLSIDYEMYADNGKLSDNCIEIDMHRISS